MKYLSTRGDKTERAFCEILLEGLAPDGGLYLPQSYPQVDALTLARWRGLSYADLAAAAQFSCADYLGDVPWQDNEAAKQWYARIKSRPSFRPLLNDRISGMIAADHYADLDF